MAPARPSRPEVAAFTFGAARRGTARPKRNQTRKKEHTYFDALSGSAGVARNRRPSRAPQIRAHELCTFAA